MMQLLQTLTANEQKLILVSAVFGLYLLAIFVFAIIYYRQFLSAPSSFEFTSSIAEGQRANRIAEMRTLAQHLRGVDQVLLQIGEKIQDEPDVRIDPNKWELKTSAGSLKYITVTKYAGQFVVIRYLMVVYAPSDKEYSENLYQWVSRGRIFRAFTTIGALRRELIRERGSIKARLATALRTEQLFLAGSPDIWTFADFFYLSVIIQSTVGLGDIQPNSTKIRKIVVFQILLGYAILIVLLNIILGWQWQPV